MKINNAMYLTVHPYLAVHKTTYQNRSLILLGYILDPDKPEARDEHIINDLLQMSSDTDELILNTYRLGGRWILIADDGKELRLLHDAAGLRHVYYSDVQRTKDLWCASQPTLIAEILGLEMDQEAVDFINWFKEKNPEPWFPGDSSPYREVKCLVPNHYLNLENGNTRRYWPNKSLDELSLDEAIEKIPRKFSAIMQSAEARFDLAVALSCGWDSRLVLASCKEIRHNLTYYNAKLTGQSEKHPDCEIPRKLLSKLELNCDIFDFQNINVRDNFEEVFRSSIPFPTVSTRSQQAHLDYYGRNKVVVTGNVSDVGRCHYRFPEYRLAGKRKQEITGSTLSSLAKMRNSPFAVSSFEEWLGGLGETYNYNILDLFAWEQRVGRWFAMKCLQYDIAWKDFMTPYNTRSLLMDLLSVPEEYRRRPDYILYQKLMYALWPEALSEPINPQVPVPVLWKLRRVIGF
jgi:hypothetical protein